MMLASRTGVQIYCQVKTTLLLIQLPPSVLERAEEYGPSAWTLACHEGSQGGVLAPGFTLAQTWLLRLGSKPANGRALLLFQVLSLFLRRGLKSKNMISCDLFILYVKMLK